MGTSTGPLKTDKLSLHSTPGFAGFCTRGTGNVQLVASIPATISEIRIWQQNDEPGRKWAAQIPEFIQKTCRHTIAAVPEKFPDVNDWTRAGASVNDLLRAIEGKAPKTNDHGYGCKPAKLLSKLYES